MIPEIVIRIYLVYECTEIILGYLHTYLSMYFIIHLRAEAGTNNQYKSRISFFIPVNDLLVLRSCKISSIYSWFQSTHLSKKHFFQLSWKKVLTNKYLGFFMTIRLYLLWLYLSRYNSLFCTYIISVSFMNAATNMYTGDDDDY